MEIHRGGVDRLQLDGLHLSHGLAILLNSLPSNWALSLSFSVYPTFPPPTALLLLEVENVRGYFSFHFGSRRHLTLWHEVRVLSVFQH